MMQADNQNRDGHTGHAHAGTVQLPAPTIWPIVFAFGLALIFTGMVTHWVMSMLGALLAVGGIVGWFLEVLPQEHHVYVPVFAEAAAPVSTQAAYTQMPAEPRHRKLLPIETFSITAGIKGGLAGGTAMIVPAALFGLIRYHSIWYAVNLLAAGGFVSWAGQSDAFLAQFHLLGLLAAAGIHTTASLLIGLLYGAMLPMFPRKPILTAGFIAPFLWTGLLYSAIGVISPILNQRINWLWFVISQIAFGLVAGFVVNRQVKVRTAQFQALPFAVRAGLHTSAKDEGDDTP
jgi:hypothetical protein